MRYNLLILSTAILLLLSAGRLNAQSNENGDGRTAVNAYYRSLYIQTITLGLNEIKQFTEETPRAQKMNTYTVVCWALLIRGRFNEALYYARQAQNISRYDIRIIEILGEAYFRLELYQQAMNEFQRYLNYSISSSSERPIRIDRVYFFMSEIYIVFKQYHHADIALSTALHYTSKRGYWWMRYGVIKEELGEVEAALDAYRRSLELVDDEEWGQQAQQSFDRLQSGTGRTVS